MRTELPRNRDFHTDEVEMVAL